MPLAPSFDTAGWFARDGAIFARVGAAYGMTATLPARPRLLRASDAFARAGAATGDALAGGVAAAQARFGAAPTSLWRPISAPGGNVSASIKRARFGVSTAIG